MAHQCKVFFFVGIFGRNNPPPPKEGAITPLIHVVWNMGWQASAAAAAADTKKVDLKLTTYSGFQQGFIGADLIVDVFELNPKVRTEADALAAYGDPNFRWKDKALAVTLHSVDVGLTDTPDTGVFCTIHP